MMIPVEKDQGLSAQNNEHSIKQLRDLAEDEQHYPKSSGARTPAGSGITTHSLFIVIG